MLLLPRSGDVSLRHGQEYFLHRLSHRSTCYGTYNTRNDAAFYPNLLSLYVRTLDTAGSCT